MGARISRTIPATRRIYVHVDSKQIKVEFSIHCNSQDIRELLITAAGLNKWSTITLLNLDGYLLPISSSIPANTPITSYQLVSVNNISDVPGNGILNEMVSRLSDEFSKAFIDEFTRQFSDRLNTLEKKSKDNSSSLVTKNDLELPKLTDSLRQATMQSLELEEQQVMSKNVPQSLKYVLTEETVRYLRRPTFNIWNWEANEMLCLIEHMYHELGIVGELKIDPIILRRWLMYGMINLCNLSEIFTKIEIAVLITASVCHDLDHPGFNNNYQINARTELAIRYNDISPLENHHCAVTFQILERPETNIFKHVSPEHYKKIRTEIIELILATDMIKHTEFMERFRQTLEKGFDKKNEKHLGILKVVLIKCCDVSNEVRPMEVSEPWVDCLLEEYFMQGDREKLEGLPVAPIMDREKVTKSTAQIGFIKFVLIPIFEHVKQLFPEVEEAMLKPLQYSLDHYQQLQSKDNLTKDKCNSAHAQRNQTAIGAPLNSIYSSTK